MGLQNLVGVSLEPITPASETIKRMLDAAARHIADAKVKAISAETRFASAYTAIRMLADVGLRAHGYRTLTSKPGHHQTAIQTLPTTLGLELNVFEAMAHGYYARDVTAPETQQAFGDIAKFFDRHLTQ